MSTPHRSAADIILSFAKGPFYHTQHSASSIMWQVVIALVPASFAGCFLFGTGALTTIAQCVVYSLVFEFFTDRFFGRRFHLADSSTILIGFLLACNLPPSAPWYVCAVGSFVGVVVVKGCFGGLGKNIFNPVLVGRAFCMFAFPTALSAFRAPLHSFGGIDAVTAATPLTILKNKGIAALIAGYGDPLHLSLQLIFGSHAGCIGETSAIALILGGTFLLVRGIISWHIPISMIGMVGLIALAAGHEAGGAVVHMLSGGLLLGAFFMATDYITAPVYPLGKIIFGIGCASILMTIRLWGVYPEGCMFSILIMNIFTPMIDRVTFPRRFGVVKRSAA